MPTGRAPPFRSFQGVLPVSPAALWEGRGRGPHLGRSGVSSGFWLQELTCGHWGALKALPLWPWCSGGGQCASWRPGCLVVTRPSLTPVRPQSLTEALGTREDSRGWGQWPGPESAVSCSACHPSGGFGQVLSSRVSIVMLVKWSRHLFPQPVMLWERHQTV